MAKKVTRNFVTRVDEIDDFYFLAFTDKDDAGEDDEA